jgi:hypothetical protein
MTNTDVAVARLSMPARGRVAMSAAGFIPSARADVVTGYTKLAAARNATQGAQDAWSPPV